MKSNLKIKTIILIAVGIFIGFSTLRNASLNFNAGNNDEINLDAENLKLSAVSGKIHIDNNWTAAKAAGIVTGNGTYSEPYIIEDLVIDGGGSGSCILIENSDVYFKIENCSLYNSSGGYPNAGIRLSYVNNSQLIDNNCSHNYHGIYLEYSYYNIISGNTANSNTYYGIRLRVGYNNIITGNIANYSNNYGILIFGSNNTISGNTAKYNKYGIYIDENNNNDISGNTAKYNEYGIYLDESDKNDISGNTATNNDFGIFFDGSLYNNITGNTANNNLYGIRLTFSFHNDILENTVNNNELDGLYLGLCGSNEIMGNTINNNSLGVFLQDSDDNTFYLNNLANINENVFFIDSTNKWNSQKKITYVYKDKSYTNYLGNYWSDYNGSDADNDGIGDTSFILYMVDNYPLIESIENYKIIGFSVDSEGAISGYNLFFLLGILSVVALTISIKLKNFNK